MSMANISCSIKNPKYFWRGSTPNFKFKFSVVISKFNEIEIGFLQDEKLVLKKKLSDFTKKDEYTISITLTKEETMSFKEGSVTLQSQVTNGDRVIPSSPKELFCKDTVFSKENSDGYNY